MEVIGTEPTSLVDTHAHLDDDRLLGQIEEVLQRASAAGVVQIIAIGTTADSSFQTVSLAERFPGVFAAVGIQPNHVAEAHPGDMERIEELARSGLTQIVAIGETGLDRYWDYTPLDQQQRAFDRHLELARERDLPIVIHCRDCEADIVAQLQAFGPPIRGVLHSFTGGPDQAAAFLELGLSLSIAGMITFSNRKLDTLRAALREIPLDRLLLETDSPYLSPHPFRGKTNEPARVAVTAQFVAEWLGICITELAQVTRANSKQLFSLPDDKCLTA